MLPNDRQNRILGLLKTSGTVKVTEIVEQFDVSIETIRRDLAVLEKEGKVKKVYGGAMLIGKTRNEPIFESREKKSVDEKSAIALRCKELIEPGDTLLLDIGTTTLEVVRNIKDIPDITIITNSIIVLMELLDSDVNVYVLGGSLRKTEESLSGPMTLSNLDKIYVDKAILGAGGITLNNGISDYHLDEALVRRKMIERANKTIVVAESDKFGVNSFATVCQLNEIDTIITSWKLDERTSDEIRSAGVNLIIADSIE